MVCGLTPRLASPRSRSGWSRILRRVLRRLGRCWRSWIGGRALRTNALPSSTLRLISAVTSSNERLGRRALPSSPALLPLRREKGARSGTALQEDTHLTAPSTRICFPCKTLEGGWQNEARTLASVLASFVRLGLLIELPGAIEGLQGVVDGGAAADDGGGDLDGAGAPAGAEDVEGAMLAGARRQLARGLVALPLAGIDDRDADVGVGAKVRSLHGDGASAEGVGRRDACPAGVCCR